MPPDHAAILRIPAVAILARHGCDRRAERMATDLYNPHDLVFRAMLSDERRAQAVLQAHLEPWVAALLADEPPVALDGSFVDEDLRGSQSDKLFQVTLRGGEPGLVYVLLEHKSSPDPGTALQVFRYKLRIWNAYAQGSRDRLRALPTIIPLVFYHGAEPWKAPGSIAEMLATRDERLRALEPSFGYWLRDLGHIPVERLAADPAARAGLVALRYSHKGEDAEKMRVLPDVLAALPDGSDFERQVVVYVMGVWKVRPETLQAAAEKAKPGRGEAVVGQIVQELIDKGVSLGLAQGLEKGLAQGLEKGLAQGMAQGMAGTLSQLLEHRFGRLPRPVRSRIAEDSPSELDARFTTALGAKSLAEVFPDLDLD